MRQTAIAFFLLTAALVATTAPLCAQNRTSSAGFRQTSGVSAQKSTSGVNNTRRTVTDKGLSTPSTSVTRNNVKSSGTTTRYNANINASKPAVNSNANVSMPAGNAGTSITGGNAGVNASKRGSSGSVGRISNGDNRSRINTSETVTRSHTEPSRNNTPGSVRRYEPQSRPAGRQPINYRGGRNPRPVIVDDHRDLRRIHPRDRGVVEVKIVNKFYRPSVKHFFGYTVSVLPVGYEIRTYYGRDYYFYNDIWYRKGPSSWYVCRPPIGYSFSAALAKTAFNACLFAYYCNVNRTFDTINENAAIITQQNELIARNNAILAEQNEAIAINQGRAANSYNLANSLGLVQSYASASEQYYYEDGVFYSKEDNGQYTVIVPPAGALVNTLPDDYDTYTVSGVEYYRVDDTLYRMVVIDGSPYFEVLGQFTNR